MKRWYFFFDDLSMCMLKPVKDVYVARIGRVPICIVERDAKVLKERLQCVEQPPGRKLKCIRKRDEVLVYRIFINESQYEISHDESAAEIVETLNAISSIASVELAKKILSLVLEWRLQELAPLCC